MDCVEEHTIKKKEKKNCAEVHTDGISSFSHNQGTHSTVHESMVFFPVYGKKRISFQLLLASFG